LVVKEYHGKNGFATAAKLGTTDKTFVDATKNFAVATKRFFDIIPILKNDFFSIKTFFLSDAAQREAETHLRFSSTGFDCYDFLALSVSVAILLSRGIDMQSTCVRFMV